MLKLLPGGIYAETININTLAELCGCSLRTFGRKFKQAFHITPEKFIKTIRIKSACHLLANSRESIKRIAHLTGFCHQAYLAQQFNYAMGLSSRDYRKKYFKGD